MSTLIFFFQLKRNVENCGQFSTVPLPHPTKKIMPRSHYTEIHTHIYVCRETFPFTISWTAEKPRTQIRPLSSSLKLCVLRGPGNVFPLMVGSFSSIVSGIMRGDRGNMRQYRYCWSFCHVFFFTPTDSLSVRLSPFLRMRFSREYCTVHVDEMKPHR